MAGWTREAIAVRVAELRREHEGRAFVEAVGRFGHEALDAGERRVLGEVLLERAGEEGGSPELERRLAEGGWIRRTLRRAEERGAEAARRRRS